MTFCLPPPPLEYHVLFEWPLWTRNKVHDQTKLVWRLNSSRIKEDDDDGKGIEREIFPSSNLAKKKGQLVHFFACKND